MRPIFSKKIIKELLVFFHGWKYLKPLTSLKKKNGKFQIDQTKPIKIKANWFGFVWFDLAWSVYEVLSIS